MKIGLGRQSLLMNSLCQGARLTLALLLAGALLSGCKQTPQEPTGAETKGLERIEVRAAKTRLPVPAVQRLTAIGYFNDGSRENLTQEVTWLSSDPDVAVVNDATRKGRVTTKGIGSTQITALTQGVLGSVSLTVTGAKLESIQVEPIRPSIPWSLVDEVQFYAMGIFSDGSKEDLTEVVTFSSSDDSLLSLIPVGTNAGLSNPLGAGSVTVTARTQGVSGSTTATLTSDAAFGIATMPYRAQRSSDDGVQVQAFVLLNDYSLVDITKLATWSSSNSSLAQVSNQEGLQGWVTAIAAGAPTIDATLDNISSNDVSTITLVDNATLTKVIVTPADAEVVIGQDQQMRAFAYYDVSGHVMLYDVTPLVSWSLGDPTLGEICNVAACKGLLRANTSRTNKGLELQVKASLRNKVGYTYVTLTSYLDELAEVQLYPMQTSYPQAMTPQLKAYARFTSSARSRDLDMTDQVTWSSNRSGVAQVQNQTGLAGGMLFPGSGTTTLATKYDQVSSKKQLEVLSGYSLSSVTVLPPSLTCPVGVTTPLKAVALYSNGSSYLARDVTELAGWVHSTGSIAMVNKAAGGKGETDCVASGSTTITASLDGVSGSSAITVNANLSLNSLLVTPLPLYSPQGHKTAMKAVAQFINASSNPFGLFDVTDQAVWTSGNVNRASLGVVDDTAGHFLARGNGSVQITARYTADPLGSPVTKSLSQTTTINSFNLSYLNLHPRLGGNGLAQKQLYDLEAVYHHPGTGNDLIVDATPQASFWGLNSQGDLVADLWVNPVDKGWFWPQSAGVYQVYGGYQSERVKTRLVGSGRLESIAFAASSVEAPLGSQITPQLLGTYADGSQREINEHAVFLTSNSSGIQVSNLDGERGRLYPLNLGATQTATITAVVGSYTATTSVTSTYAAPSALALSASSVTLRPMDRYALTASGTFSGATADLTQVVYWTTSDSTVVKVSNDPREQGRLLALAAGTATITASWTSPVTGVLTEDSLTVTVKDATVNNLSYNDATGQVMSLGDQVDFTVQANVGGSFDATEQANWESANPLIATVSNRPGSKGRVTAVGSGTTSIIAHYGTKTQYFTVSIP